MSEIFDPPSDQQQFLGSGRTTMPLAFVEEASALDSEIGALELRTMSYLLDPGSGGNRIGPIGIDEDRLIAHPPIQRTKGKAGGSLAGLTRLASAMN
jgi:hypothetical protein